MTSHPPATDDGARPLVAVVIPCYNVSRHIAGVVASIPVRYPLIVAVDDASTDDTLQAVESINDPRVVLVRHESNGGVGAATKSGYAEAERRGATICVKMDGDGQMHGADLDALVAPLLSGESDYSKANRFVNRAALRQMPALRLVGNAGLSFLVKLASGYWNTLDVTNGFTAIRSSLLSEIPGNKLSNRYFFEISMLVELNIIRARIADVSIPARYGDEQSSLRISRVLATFPPLLARGLLRRFYWRYVISDFGVLTMCVLLGVPLLLFGAIFGGFQWIRSLDTGVPASAGTVILAALPIMVSVQLLLTAMVLDVLSSPTVKRSP